MHLSVGTAGSTRLVGTGLRGSPWSTAELHCNAASSFMASCLFLPERLWNEVPLWDRELLGECVPA